MSAIEVDRLSKTIRVGFLGRAKELLRDVTFSVAGGKTVGFIGANGAGKSTTIKHLIGGARPTAGTVRVLGEDPTRASVRRRLGYMPEVPTLPPTLSALELLSLHASLCGLREPKKRIDELLERVDLAQQARQRVGGFSKGMQTRLSLALALVHEPELLILDEPMSGLDPVGRQLVRTLLHEYGAAGRTILFSSHVLSDVEALCDEVVVIRGGRLVYAGATSEAVGTAPNRWRLRVLAQDPRALEGSAEVKLVKKEGDTFVIEIDGADGLAAAAALQARGARVLSLEAKRPTLEERTAEWIGGTS